MVHSSELLEDLSTNCRVKICDEDDQFNISLIS